MDGRPERAPVLCLAAAAAAVIVVLAAVPAAAVAQQEDQNDDPPPVVVQAAAQTVVVAHRSYLRYRILSFAAHSIVFRRRKNVQWAGAPRKISRRGRSPTHPMRKSPRQAYRLPGTNAILGTVLSCQFAPADSRC